jgi:hypothetical protein
MQLQDHAMFTGLLLKYQRLYWPNQKLDWSEMPTGYSET